MEYSSARIVRCPRFAVSSSNNHDSFISRNILFALAVVTAELSWWGRPARSSDGGAAPHFERDRRYLLIIAYLPTQRPLVSFIRSVADIFCSLLPGAFNSLLDLSSPTLLFRSPLFSSFRFSVPQSVRFPNGIPNENNDFSLPKITTII